VYALHFVVPLAFAALVWQYRRGKYWRFMIALLLTSYAAFVTFMLVPTAPPWLASWAGSLDDVRLIHHSSYSFFIYNKASPNPVAAMPSLHASYPWLFFLFAIHLWGKRGAPVILYAFAVFLACVYLGHHYMADIIGGVIYATVAFYVVCGPIGDYVVNRWSSRARKVGAAAGAEEIGAPVEAVAVAGGLADADRRSTKLEDLT
jgi:membrane-associated phospholipid phosphatase